MDLCLHQVKTGEQDEREQFHGGNIFKVREFKWNVRNTGSKIYFITINMNCSTGRHVKKSENYYLSESQNGLG